jgi:hypothetical protein
VNVVPKPDKSKQPLIECANLGKVIMTLLEAILDLDRLDEASTIYAASPWSADSQVVVAQAPDTGQLPPEAQRRGLQYFLEVAVARDFLDGWAAHLASQPTTRERCARLIQYALNDA